MTSKFAAIAAGLALALTLTSATGVLARTAPQRIPTPSIEGRSATTPLAMLYFCAAHRAECKPSQTASVTATPEMMNVLNSVNKRINGAIIGRRDSADVWSLNPRYGDCEDYALSKRSALISKGVPAGALRIGITRTRGGEPHAVLIVKTTGGDLVLDNMNQSVKTLASTGYRISTMSSANPSRWIAG